jgi:hypothetical protein
MANNIFPLLERLDHLIHIKATGTPKQLADKLNICERGVRGYISILKDLGAPIIYCRKRNSYCYQEEGRFYCKFLKINASADDNFPGGGGKYFQRMILQLLG